MNRHPTLTRVNSRPDRPPTWALRKPGTSRVVYLGPEDLEALRGLIEQELGLI